MSKEGGQDESMLQRLSAVESCVLGMAAGCGAKACNYPLLVFKNNTQQGITTSLDPRKLYRGLSMSMLNLGGTTAVQFGTTGAFQKMIRAKLSEDPNVVHMGGAFLGGLASGLPCCMWELTMIQQQRFGGSLQRVPIAIVSEFGLLGLFRGLSMTLGRESLYTLALLGITPSIQRELCDKHGIFQQPLSTVGFTQGLDSDVGLAAGALFGALLSATLTHPLDTIKTCQQGDLRGQKFGSASATYSMLLKESGSFAGLFKGLSWRISSIATTFFLVNRFKEPLASLMFPHASLS